MDDTKKGSNAPADTPEEVKPTHADVQWAKVVDALSPHLHEYVTTFLKSTDENQRFLAKASTVLLLVVIVCFSALAAAAMLAGHVETAEKIVIGLFSFLGGAAMFGQGAKK